jgi:ATP-dependent RNA helicase DDX5/DBP2|tara:strand:+ start:201 stop:1649 length:1449 start_codon:yes stop_codon:yes gene_type:complete
MDVTVEVPPGTEEATPPIESFDDMMLDAKIMMDIKFKEYDKPTPIQAQAIPIICAGRDVLGCAETGSGKTAAFSIPMIQHCLQQPEIKRGDGPFAIVMAPTRELAQQIEKEAKTFSRSSKGFKTTIVVGGTNMSEQKMDLRNGVEVCVATPGRLIDHLHQGNTNLARVSLVILDEADRMLDMGFEPQIREVMMNLPTPHQTLLFSATMPVEVEALAADYLNKPVKVKVGAVSVPTSNVAQHLEKLVDAQKVDRLCELLLEEKSEAEKFGGTLPMTVVFVERKARADEIMTLLNEEGVAAAAFHGGRSQQEREAALSDFTTGKCAVLVATDVAARGLDVKGVMHVVNLDLPRMFEDYVHRVGRTGRAGMTGRATSFYTDRDSFLVAQIKRALQDLENGNAFAFATGKEARAKEREAQKAWREGRAAEPEQAAVGGVDIIVDDKFKHMKLSASTASLTSAGGAGAAAPAGNADDAFGSDDDDDW